MHHIAKPPKMDRGKQCPISRRALLEGSVNVAAAVGGWAGATLLPGAANAADPVAGSLRNQDDRAALQRSQPGTELPHRLRRMARLPARRQAALSARI